MGFNVVARVTTQRRKGFISMNDEIFETIKLMREKRTSWLDIFKKYENEFKLKSVSEIRLTFGREMIKRGIKIEYQDLFQRYREFMGDK